MGERIGPARIDRMHEESLRGARMGVLSNGNGSREVSFLGRRREVDISGKNGEAVGVISKFLQEEFEVNEEIAIGFATEICDMKEG
jgi:hypothetical protein